MPAVPVLAAPEIASKFVRTLSPKVNVRLLCVNVQEVKDDPMAGASVPNCCNAAWIVSVPNVTLPAPAPPDCEPMFVLAVGGAISK